MTPLIQAEDMAAPGLNDQGRSSIRFYQPSRQLGELQSRQASAFPSARCWAWTYDSASSLVKSKAEATPQVHRACQQAPWNKCACVLQIHDLILCSGMVRPQFLRQCSVGITKSTEWGASDVWGL